MQLGIIGLGRMGGNIARRLVRDGHEVVAYDQDAATATALVDDGIGHAESLAALVASLDAPRAIWVMLPAGDPTEATINTLSELMAPGDTIIDGGNTFYKDDIRRAKALEPKGLHYVDVGTSGGVWGLERGYCMMVGAEDAIFDRLEPLFDSLAPGYGDLERTRGRNAPDERAERGYIHAGPVGAGHYVKMVHNGIEYGLMQAYAEGFELMQSKASPELPEDQRFDLNLADVAEVWRRGSVVSSWLLDLTAQALAGDPRLDHYSGAVSDSGEGRWTVDAAVEQGVSTPVLANALFSRFASRQENTYANRLLSAMRFGFGGHVEPPKQ
ncbi:phosphogluconate dehydrogenase (NAD(+)-dependent, decarboxylating) [Halomonas sp. B23F22_10]|uniref:phosphogluconate dehydrogenase (NAD(+)-dependent, decarboxylating) n=1 Tax=Halomonas sp. B23F22_10 TaxID=3459515 RepID=UPI00373E3867